MEIPYSDLAKALQYCPQSSWGFWLLVGRSKEVDLRLWLLVANMHN